MQSDIHINAAQLDRLLEDRGWTRQDLATRAGIPLQRLQEATDRGTGPLQLGWALATALGVSPALLDADSAQGRDWIEHRKAKAAFLLVLLFLVSAFLGYQVGSDYAARANRADCAAAGGTDCGISTR
ncbi:hypothetical protein [Pseudoxanthomonas mexicana]|uniref:hypothetical protein n=1 Tax=Pseudoxanthomonas mexicana TaxID=128785 RepID=UPI00398AD405